MSKNNSSLFKFKKIDFTTNQDYPNRRSGHRAVFNESDDSFYIWGGYYPEESIIARETKFNLYPELWQYNISSRQWYILETSGEIPNKTILSHASIIHGNTLIVFGGTGYPFGVDLSNSIYLCNLKNLEWRRLETHNEPPLTFYGSSLVLKNEFLFILFGTTGHNYHSNVYKINLNTLESIKLFDSDQLKQTDSHTRQQELDTLYPNNFLNGRYRQECVFHKNEIWTFGGASNVGGLKMDTIPVFNLTDNKWKFIQTNADINSNQHYPEERKCHSCIKIDQFVYICGGQFINENNYPVLVENKLWRLDLETLIWERLNIEMPIVTYFHASASNARGELWVHGGCTVVGRRADGEPIVSRNSDLHKIKLKIQKLADLAWEELLNSFPNLVELDKKVLTQIGLPINYIKRIN